MARRFGAVRVLARSPDQLTAVTARLELISTGQSAPAIGVSAVPADTRVAEGQTLRDLFFDVPLTNVPPGDYVARAEIRANGELVSELRRQVTVVAGAAPPSTAVNATAANTPAASPSGAADSEIAKSIG